MGHHKRTFGAKIRRKAKHFILKLSYHDPILAESVNRVSRAEVISHCAREGGVQIAFIPDVEKGEVLVDSRGRGSWQT